MKRDTIFSGIHQICSFFFRFTSTESFERRLKGEVIYRFILIPWWTSSEKRQIEQVGSWQPGINTFHLWTFGQLLSDYDVSVSTAANWVSSATETLRLRWSRRCCEAMNHLVTFHQLRTSMFSRGYWDWQRMDVLKVWWLNTCHRRREKQAVQPRMCSIAAKHFVWALDCLLLQFGLLGQVIAMPFKLGTRLLKQKMCASLQESWCVNCLE